MPKRKNGDLTPKEKRFCQEYVIDLNGTRAAIRAGYSKKTAQEMASQKLLKVIISDYIATLQKNIASKLDITQEWVVKRFKDISDRCMTAEPVIEFIDGEWINTGEYKFDSSGANKATEMLGKHLGIFDKDNKQKQLILKPVIFDNTTALEDSIHTKATPSKKSSKK